MTIVTKWLELHCDSGRPVKSALDELADADAHSRRTIISTGKCPRCRGTGQAIRAVVGTCPACNGAGAVLPTMAHIKQRYCAEVASQFTRAVTALQVAQGSGSELSAPRSTGRKLRRRLIVTSYGWYRTLGDICMHDITPQEVKDDRAAAGLTQAQAAKVIHNRFYRNW